MAVEAGAMLIGMVVEEEEGGGKDSIPALLITSPLLHFRSASA